MANTRVFISHAVKDKPLVDAFFDLLQTGVGLSPHDTFCSSLEGMGIPGGQNFISCIKEQIKTPELVLLILTPNYLESLFCQCELGAGWVLSHNTIPILVPPTSFSELRAVLTGTQAYRMDSDTNLSDLRDQIIRLLQTGGISTSRWDAKKKQFLERLPKILSKIETPKRISLQEHQMIKQQHEESEAEIKRLKEEAEMLKEQIQKLKECKDRDEVLAVELEFSTAWDEFESLCMEASKRSDSLYSVVIEAVFHNLTDSGCSPSRRESRGEISTAVQEDYLHLDEDDGVVSINREDPKVSRYLEALSAVERFLDNIGDSWAFVEKYKKEYDHRPVFSSRKLWELHLGLKAYTKWEN